MQSSVRLKSQASCIKFIFLLNENIECIMISTDEKLVLLNRIADALDRLAPPKNAEIDLTAHQGYLWVAEKSNFYPVDEIQRLPLESLHGIDNQKHRYRFTLSRQIPSLFWRTDSVIKENFTSEIQQNNSPFA